MATWLLTYKELAEEWGTTVNALAKRVERGELPVVRDGRRIRFDRLQLQAFLRDRTEEPWA